MPHGSYSGAPCPVAGQSPDLCIDSRIVDLIDERTHPEVLRHPEHRSSHTQGRYGLAGESPDVANPELSPLWGTPLCSQP